MNTAADRRAYRGPALFSMGFRPFFLFSALWSAIAAPLWVHAFLTGGAVGLDWHVHEMLFGYTGGVIVGFLLTAVPNWTGRLPVIGAPLMLLFALWAMGRAVMLAPIAGVDLGPWAMVAESLFLFAVAAALWREILAGRNWRNLPVAMMVTLFAVANGGFHLEAADGGGAPLATRCALAVILMLIALIGGRITPSFTRNWQIRRGGPLPATPARFDIAVLAATGAALLAWIVAPLHPVSGAILMAAGAANLARLARWRGDATVAEPLVLILHVGYLWLALGLGLIGLANLTPALVAPSAGIHALTAGAVGVMTLAVMTRASRGHTGRPLTAGRGEAAIYLLVNAGALARVVGGLAPGLYQPLLIVSAVLWSGAFLTFVVIYGPMLLRPRPAAQA